MILFFNDTFLEREFIDVDEDSFRKSCELLFEINHEIKSKKLEFSNQSITLKCSKTAIDSFFKEIRTKDLEVLFLKSLSNVNVKFWDLKGTVQDNKYHYFFNNTSSNPPTLEDVGRSTLAEAAEVVKRGDKSILAINLPDLFFSKCYQIHVNIFSIADRNEIFMASINCSDNGEGVRLWIDCFFNEKLKYKDFSRTPLDEETCLNNRQKFSIFGGSKNQGRQVYQDIQKRFWCVDNEHRGKGAHLEVFDESGVHAGEADLRGTIDFSKKVPGRILESV